MSPRFEALPSRTPFSPVRTSERIDPYYDALWTDGAYAAWLSKARSERTERAGLGTLPKHLGTEPAEAWARLEDGRAWEQKLTTLAAVDSWRTMTTEQCAALTGEHRIASGVHRTTGDLFAARLLDIGVFSDAMNPGARQARGTLLRPAVQSAATDRMEELMTYPEWVSVTAGRGFENQRQFDRHNLLATELGLRIAEFCEVGTVLGEKLSVVNDLAWTGWGLTPPLSASQQTADLTIVRADGLRIAVEITASQGPDLVRKMERWAAVLARRPLKDSGLVVLFVVAPRPDGPNSSNARTLKAVRHAMTRAARLSPGTGHDRTANRMMVASWCDWFPERGAASAEFLGLRSERPTGSPDNPWTSVDILDLVQLPYLPAGDTQLAILDNASGLRSTPYWLRRGQAPELWSGALDAAGFTGMPAISTLTGDGVARSELGAAKGVAGAAKPSARLVF